MKSFKLWVPDNKHLREAVKKQAAAMGFTWPNVVDKGSALFFKGTSIRHDSSRRKYFEEYDLPEISLSEFFELQSKREVFNTFTGEKTEVSEESFQDLKKIFQD